MEGSWSTFGDRLKSSTSPAKGNSLQRGGGQKARSYFLNMPGDIDLKNKCGPVYQFLASHSWIEKVLHAWFSIDHTKGPYIVFTLSVNIRFQRTVGFLLVGGGGVYRKMVMNFLLLATLNFWDGPLWFDLMVEFVHAWIFNSIFRILVYGCMIISYQCHVNLLRPPVHIAH